MSEHSITYNLNDAQMGGIVTNFNYSRSLNELISTWSADIAGDFKGKAGDSITFSGVMANGVISKVRKGIDGLFSVEGYDAGVRLMKTTPHSKNLVTGGASAVIGDLAEFCGIGLSMNSSGLGGFDVRSAVTGTTCAEAILELASLSGCIAYINNAGTLVVASPSNYTPVFQEPVLDDTGSELDLDGYATQVTCVVNRRKETIKEEKNNNQSGRTYYKGTTPSGSLERETHQGSFNYVDLEGKDVSGTYKVVTIKPFGVMSESETTITRDGITITTKETHAYVHKTKTVWRGDTEYRLWAWCEQGYSITKTTEGAYESVIGGNTHFKEITQELLERSFSLDDALWIPEDWKGNLDMVSRELYTRTTDRVGGKEPDSNMPTYNPPENFDSLIDREFKRMDFGKGLLCLETEISFEARQVGSIENVHRDGQAFLNYNTGRYIAVAAHTAPLWVQIQTYRTYYEKYKADGSCEFSSKTEYCDDGAKWMLLNGIQPTGRADEDEYQQDYAKFTQKTSGITTQIGGGGISTTQWQFLEQAGRRKITGSSDENGYAVDAEEWYQNGQYVPSKYCPHYETANKTCSVSGISAIGGFDGEDCPSQGRSWRGCIRAVAALEQARSEQDRPLMEPAVYGIAGDNGSRATVGYRREFYVDNIISTSQAQAIAETAASNLLKIKGRKGYRKTVTIPYNPTFVPDGTITAVSHDWGAMTTQVTYKTGGYIPSFMIPASVGGISSGVSDRDASRRTRSMTGTVGSIGKDGVVKVDIGNVTYDCTTKLVNIGVGDSVLVSFASGNGVRGHITDRL